MIIRSSTSNVQEIMRHGALVGQLLGGRPDSRASDGPIPGAARGSKRLPENAVIAARSGNRSLPVAAPGRAVGVGPSGARSSYQTPWVGFRPDRHRLTLTLQHITNRPHDALAVGDSLRAAVPGPAPVAVLTRFIQDSATTRLENVHDFVFIDFRRDDDVDVIRPNMAGIEDPPTVRTSLL